MDGVRLRVKYEGWGVMGEHQKCNQSYYLATECPMQNFRIQEQPLPEEK
jgi:hypothetical protein